jgi:hydrogenase nickel incorporation protein HypA/HybF
VLESFVLIYLAGENSIVLVKVSDMVWLEIGPFSGVEVSALEFSFEVAVRGSIADGAALEIIQTQANAWCFS